MFKLKNMINFLILDISHYMNNYLINPQVQIGVFLDPRGRIVLRSHNKSDKLGMYLKIIIEV
jgi:hypothetical protein